MGIQSVSPEKANKQEKAPGNLITDEFSELKRIAHLLGVIRDGSRDADVLAWRDMIDMTLEHEVYRLNSILKDLCETFEGLSFNPVRISTYSMLHGTTDLAHLEE